MSLTGLCSLHTVKVTRRDAVVGSSMGVGYTKTRTDTLKCNVQQPSARKSADYASRGIKVSHELYFSSDPDLTINDQLEWVEEGITLEVTDARKRSDGTGARRLWIIGAEQVTQRPVP